MGGAVAALAALRLDTGLTQAALARAAGMSRAHLSEIEAGLATPSLAALARLSAALGGELTVRTYPGSGPLVRDHLQVAMAEAFLAVTDRSWRPRVEVSVPPPARGFIDLVLHDPHRHQAIAIELHSQLRRVEQQLRWAQAKAESMGTTHPPDTEVVRVLVLRSTEANRRLVALETNLFRAAFPGRAADAYASLTHPTDRWPGDTLLWATIAGHRARILAVPPRGIRVGR